MALFRVERNPKCKDRLLGYEWIEVLAIEPWALGNPEEDEEEGEWCYKTVMCLYICRTDEGLSRITSDDFWTAVEEYKEYALAEGQDESF